MSFLLQPRRSLTLLVLFILIHSAAFFVLLLQPLSWLLEILSLSLVVASVIYILRRHVFLSDNRSVFRCWREANGGWRIQFRNGFVASANLLETSFISPYLMLLNFKIAGRRLPMSLPLAFDSASKDVLRQLRLASRQC